MEDGLVRAELEELTEKMEGVEELDERDSGVGAWRRDMDGC